MNLNPDLTDSVLTLVCEAVALDRDAMTVVDMQTPEVRAAVALLVFGMLSFDEKMRVAMRAEMVETAMRWLEA